MIEYTRPCMQALMMCIYEPVEVCLSWILSTVVSQHQNDLHVQCVCVCVCVYGVHVCIHACVC